MDIFCICLDHKGVLQVNIIEIKYSNNALVMIGLIWLGGNYLYTVKTKCVPWYAGFHEDKKEWASDTCLLKWLQIGCVQMEWPLVYCNTDSLFSYVSVFLLHIMLLSKYH